MKFKAILFDLDGTLLDTLGDIAESMNRTLAILGHPVHEHAKYRYFIGDGIETLAKVVLPEHSRTEETIKRCVNLFREDYALHWGDTTKPYEGIEVLLGTLKKNGIRMAVLSNKADVFTQKMIQTFFADKYFEAVRGALPTLPKKPDPQSALEIAQLFLLDPTAFMLVGDTRIDMETAKNAGMYAVGALWGYRDAEELIASGAQKIAASPTEIIELMGL